MVDWENLTDKYLKFSTFLHFQNISINEDKCGPRNKKMWVLFMKLGFFSPHTEKKKQIMRKFSNNTKKIPHFKIVFSL